jgi:DNA topoisomerase-2
MSSKVHKLTHCEHILKRPDSYVGGVDKTSEELWVVDKEGTRFTREIVTYSPALLKIFDEILVNALDRNAEHPTLVNSIGVTVSDAGEVCVENNGPLGGIAVEMHEKEGIFCPELVFGHLLTSTNYDDTEKRLVGGRNGYGAKLTNVFSRQFKIKIKDPVNKLIYSQVWKNNMKVCEKPTIKPYAGATSLVSVTFTPDWEKFGMSHMETDFHKLIHKRVWDANVCTSPKCKVKFNGEALARVDLEAFAKMHGLENACCVETPRWSVCVGASGEGFTHVSFVNGICTTKGGTHVESVANLIAQGLMDEMKSKIKLTATQVKNSFMLFVKSTLENPTFSSQIKNECTSKPVTFGSTFEPPTKTFFKNVLKTGIQDELLSLSKFKEMKLLAKTDGSARKSKITGIPKLDDANKAGTAQSHKCTLILTEGDSAKSLAIAGLSVVGRDYYGVFPLRGKVLNVRDASVNQISGNAEFQNIKKILGLQQGKVYTNLSELRYSRLMIMTDADDDGTHIKGLILNLIHVMWPSLLKLNFVVSMITPVVKVSGKHFYNLSSFRTWWEKNGSDNLKVKYYKGLGTSTSAEAREYFTEIEKLTVAFEMDEEADTSMKLAFDKRLADDRKILIQEKTKNSGNEIDYGKIKNISITDFVHKDLVNFSIADLRRSVAHVADGLKPSQRKVLYACFVRNLTQEMKVAQLASYVSEKTAYHHGEVSLAETIIKLAQDFTGSNNINVLEPCGQFGTRLMGGKDASQPRYIFTKLSPETRQIFDARDDAILNYLQDDGKKVEPEFFVPTTCMVLVNGSKGIGTGFSSSIPPYNPKDVRDNIKRILIGAPVKDMQPWFKNFQGAVEQVDEQTWVTTGIFENGVITELPPGRWIQDFKEHLDKLVDDKLISNYVNNSTTEKVHFKIVGYTGSEPVKDFKLSETFKTSNMHLFHPSGIKRYNTPNQILSDYVDIRMEYFEKRKKHLLEKLQAKALVCSHKAQFVWGVVNDHIRVFKRKRKDLEEDISKLFPVVDGNYNYLLDIKTWQYTEEAIKSLLEQTKEAQREYTELKNKKPREMWLESLL